MNSGEGKMLKKQGPSLWESVSPVVCAVLLTQPCGLAQESAPEAPPSNSHASSHERMLALLAEIAREPPLDNPFLNTTRVEKARAQWQAVKDSGTPVNRWMTARQLGNLELEQGNEEAAIEALEAALVAYDQIPIDKLAGDNNTKIALSTYYKNLTWFDLGVAYLRYGETQNCCLRHTGESCIMPLRG